MNENLKEVGKVFPSEEVSVFVADDKEYDGAHTYVFKECLGFNDGKTQYTDSVQQIDFIKKTDDGQILEGLQSEQLLVALLDRHRKLNARFPSANGEMMLNYLEKALTSLEARVRERMERGVMGELKK